MYNKDYAKINVNTFFLKSFFAELKISSINKRSNNGTIDFASI